MPHKRPGPTLQQTAASYMESQTPAVDLASALLTDDSGQGFIGPFLKGQSAARLEQKTQLLLEVISDYPTSDAVKVAKLKDFAEALQTLAKNTKDQYGHPFIAAGMALGTIILIGAAALAPEQNPGYQDQIGAMFQGVIDLFSGVLKLGLYVGAGGLAGSVIATMMPASRAASPDTVAQPFHQLCETILASSN